MMADMQGSMPGKDVSGSLAFSSIPLGRDVRGVTHSEVHAY